MTNPVHVVTPNAQTGIVVRRSSTTGKSTGNDKRSLRRTEDKEIYGVLGRLKALVRLAIDLLLSPYRWLFPQELFWGRRKNNNRGTLPRANSLPQFSVSKNRISAGGDFVEHAPSWSRAELFGHNKPTDRRLSIKLSQLLATANEPSLEPYCLRNRIIAISDIPHLPPSAFTLPRRNSLGSPFQHPLTLVLDLDETLVFTTSESSGTCDLIAEVPQFERPRAPPLLYYVHKRPFLDKFLSIVREWFQLAIYTASRAEYASLVCDWLDPDRAYFGGRRLFRDACVDRNGLMLKDLQLIEPDLAKVCLIDNSPGSFLLCPDNAIPIFGWSKGPDRALLQLLPFLDALRFTSDVRSILSLRRVA